MIFNLFVLSCDVFTKLINVCSKPKDNISQRQHCFGAPVRCAMCDVRWWLTWCNYRSIERQFQPINQSFCLNFFLFLFLDDYLSVWVCSDSDRSSLQLLIRSLELNGYLTRFIWEYISAIGSLLRENTTKRNATQRNSTQQLLIITGQRKKQEAPRNWVRVVQFGTMKLRNKTRGQRRGRTDNDNK